MRTVFVAGLAGLLLLAPNAVLGQTLAQPAGKLESDLGDVMHLRPNDSRGRDDVAQRLTDDLIALAAQDVRPSTQTVRIFVEELTTALLMRDLSAVGRRAHLLRSYTIGVQPMHEVSGAVFDALQGPHQTDRQFRAALDRFREGLILFGVSEGAAGRATDRLLSLGREIRGPEERTI